MLRALLVLVVAAGCSPPPESTAPARPTAPATPTAPSAASSAAPGVAGDSLTGVRWRLTVLEPPTGEAVLLPPGERLTLTLGADASYTGEAGCNRYGGTVGAAGGTPTLGPARSTRMACPEPSAAGDLLAALGGARVTDVRAGTMTLTSPAGDRLTFESGPDVWDEARAAGVSFRAVGQEPGWMLEVVPGATITLTADYGERIVVVPDPGAQTDGARTVYDAATEAHRLRVEIGPGPCTDAMSGVPYPLVVVVTLASPDVASGDLRYDGCGRALD